VVAPLQRAGAVDVIAAGKAAGAMLAAFAAVSGVPLRRIMGVGPASTRRAGSERRTTADTSPIPSRDTLPGGAQWFDGGHPLPTQGSVDAAARALAIAHDSGPNDLLVVLLSGGGSALMAMPAGGVSLADKQETARRLMANGADIHDLNTVRKHLSAIKGGQLAAASAAPVMTLAISDVVGDDVSVIASGPTVPDISTFADALAILTRRGGTDAYPSSIVARLRAGADGRIAETPSPDDPRLARATARIIGPQRGAVDGARAAAAGLGYHVIVIDAPVTGEARAAARAHVATVARMIGGRPRPLCVISSGETTVTVRGQGTGGRNQEFALAMAPLLTALGGETAGASIGTDGIDGPTDAAGAIVDGTTLSRAAALSLDPAGFLDDNNAYVFFDRLGDLVRTGPTNTNVGDLQVMLIA
jgi:hydroxypyruvate reductase